MLKNEINTLILNVQIACKRYEKFPKKSDLYKWIKATKITLEQKSKITIRLVNEKESRKLNSTYRGKNKSTNILSFPFDYSFENLLKSPFKFLGDLIICPRIIKQESIIYKKNINAHWAHIVIHGALHLVGYDHKKKDEATIMKNLERKTILSLGYQDPFL